MTIVMGLYTNRAYAIAPGLGLNAFVAFTLVADEGLGFPEAMGLVVVEGLAITSSSCSACASGSCARSRSS